MLGDVEAPDDPDDPDVEVEVDGDMDVDVEPPVGGGTLWSPCPVPPVGRPKY